MRFFTKQEKAILSLAYDARKILWTKHNTDFIIPYFDLAYQLLDQIESYKGKYKPLFNMMYDNLNTNLEQKLSYLEPLENLTE
jgi:hypothetical protein